MRVDWATLANAAETTSAGLLNILGGGWDTGTRASFPAPFGGALAIRLVFHRGELEQAHSLAVTIDADDGTRVVEFVHEFDALASDKVLGHLADEVPVPIAVNLSQLPIPRAGLYSIDISVDGTRLRTLFVMFQQLPA